MWNLKSKINEQTKQKQTHGHRDETDDGCQSEQSFGGLHQKGEGVKKYKLVVIKQSHGCKMQPREQSQ